MHPPPDWPVFQYSEPVAAWAELVHLPPDRVQVRAGLQYVANVHILGLSKLARRVRLFARRFTVQERVGQQMISQDCPAARR